MAGDTPEFCFFRVSVAGEVQVQPIVIQLKQQDCPKTCENFVALCSSKETTSSKRPFPSYRGTYFHRLIEGFMVQGGDFERFDGTGGYSPLFQVFDDENLRGKHDQAGIVSMANAGKNTNKSQFFITLKATPHLDGKHAVFGKVISGMERVYAMLSVEREGDRPVPLQRIVICDCGIGKGGDDDDDDDKSSSDRRHPTKHKRSREEDRKRTKRKPHSRRKHHRDRRSDEEDSSSSSSLANEDDIRHEERRRHRRHHHHKKKKKSEKRRKRSRSYSRSDDSCAADKEDKRHRNHSRRRRDSSIIDEDSNANERTKGKKER